MNSDKKIKVWNTNSDITNGFKLGCGLTLVDTPKGAIITSPNNKHKNKAFNLMHLKESNIIVIYIKQRWDNNRNLANHTTGTVILAYYLHLQ